MFSIIDALPVHFFVQSQSEPAVAETIGSSELECAMKFSSQWYTLRLLKLLNCERLTEREISLNGQCHWSLT